jgi:hypothetical protein
MLSYQTPSHFCGSPGDQSGVRRQVSVGCTHFRSGVFSLPIRSSALGEGVSFDIV